MKILRFIYFYINYLLFCRMKSSVEKSDRKIKKLESKLEFEKIYNKKISEDTLDIIKKIDHM